jgi:hypothetical protein
MADGPVTALVEFDFIKLRLVLLLGPRCRYILHVLNIHLEAVHTWCVRGVWLALNVFAVVSSLGVDRGMTLFKTKEEFVLSLFSK